MKGEFNESTFTRRRYSDVHMQQGRVKLDADWNEKLDVRVHEDIVYLDVWERAVRAVEDGSVVGAATGGPDTSAREKKLEESEDWCLRLTREVAKPGSPSSEVQFAIGRVDPSFSRPLILPESEISVDGVPWTKVGSFLGAGPTDEVYVLERDAARIEFGDGKNGARPATGARITAGYRFGGGSDGDKPITRAKK